MNAILGVIYHFIGGFASGSFYVPYKRVREWSWESMWILGGLLAWIIVPRVAAYLPIPDFWAIIGQGSPAILGFTYLFGALWGIGWLTYGLGVVSLGESVGTS